MGYQYLTTNDTSFQAVWGWARKLVTDLNKGFVSEIASGTHAAASKTPPVDADEIPLVDSASSNVLKKLTWANLKATLKTYFDTKYQPLRSACMVRKAADLTAQNFTTATVLTWDTEIYDDAAWHDTVTNPSRFTVPAGVARVRVGAAVRIVNGTAGDRARIRLLKNGTNVFNGTCSSDLQEQAAQVALSISSGPIVCAANDYFELQVFVGADVSVDITAAETNFWIEAC